MNRFKKWLKENESRIIAVADNLERLDACKVSAEIGWREAFKELLKIKQTGDKLAFYKDDVLMAIEQTIKAELGD